MGDILKDVVWRGGFGNKDPYFNFDVNKIYAVTRKDNPMQELLGKLLERDDIPMDKKAEVYDLIEAGKLEEAQTMIEELLG